MVYNKIYNNKVCLLNKKRKYIKLNHDEKYSVFCVLHTSITKNQSNIILTYTVLFTTHYNKYIVTLYFCKVFLLFRLFGIKFDN